MTIIDTHQHLWDLDQFPYSWTADLPALHRSFRLHDYLQAMEGLQIEKTVHVEPDVDEPWMLHETRHILSLAETPGNLLSGVVATCRPEHADFPRYVESFAGHPALKGLRRILHTQPDDLSQTPLFTENLRRLPAWGLSFDLCVRSCQLPLALRLIRACPETSFILDHCGNPQIKEKEAEPWRSFLREVAACPNVVCKVSGIVVNADREHWSAEELHPYVEHVIECFGWDRVMFGSDWPVCTLATDPRGWVAALAEIVKTATPQQQAALFRENARRVYRLG